MAPLPIEYHPKAVAEAAESTAWYAEIDPALGDSFADELDRALERITAAPERWAQYLHGTRSLLLSRFPYLVVYQVCIDVVRIVAVQHSTNDAPVTGSHALNLIDVRRGGLREFVMTSDLFRYPPEHQHADFHDLSAVDGVGFE